MKKNRILTESQKKQILENKQKNIIENFTNVFNKIKRLNENEIIKESLNEANDIYFDTASGAADYARENTEKRGYEIDEDDWNTQITFGGKYNRLRPGEGKTHSYSIGLLKNGKPQRKALQISLYGMPSGKFELTHYIN